MRIRFSLICVGLAATVASALELPKIEPVALTPLANLEGPPGSGEVSGIVPSRQWPGVFWVHNDSGDETRIYPVGRDGSGSTQSSPCRRPRPVFRRSRGQSHAT